MSVVFGVGAFIIIIKMRCFVTIYSIFAQNIAFKFTKTHSISKKRKNFKKLLKKVLTKERGCDKIYKLSARQHIDL